MRVARLRLLLGWLLLASAGLADAQADPPVDDLDPARA